MILSFEEMQCYVQSYIVYEYSIGWSENEILQDCKDLHVKLIDDIDGQSLFREIKSLLCFLDTNMAEKDVQNFIYSK